MHKIGFRLGLRPQDPAGEAYSAPPDFLAGFQGLTSKKRGGEGKGEERGIKEGKGRREGEGRKERKGGFPFSVCRCPSRL